jgi:hypothetical protein
MGEGANPQGTCGKQVDKKLDALETVASILAASVRSLTEDMLAAFEQIECQQINTVTCCT